MRIIAVDPSFRRTGVSIIQGDKLSIFRVTNEMDKKDFVSLFRLSKKTILNLHHSIDKEDKTNMPKFAIMECPFVGGQFSSGLFLLDGLMATYLESLTPNLYRVSTTYAKRALGSKKATKSDSTKLAKTLIPIYQKHGIEVNIPSRLSHDEAESLIFLTGGVIKFYECSDLAKDLSSLGNDFNVASIEQI